MSVSILILTLNEEANIVDCMRSLPGFDDIVVLDSHSVDNTCDLAIAGGARVVKRKFDNWAAHQNWVLDNIDFKYEWVFYLDADERMTDDLREEILALSNDCDNRNSAYYVGRMNYFMGKWIKYSMPPGFIMRFFKPSKIRFKRLVNPVPVVDGPVGYLSGMLLHYNFSKGLTEWVDKHNKYSQMEAQETLKTLDADDISIGEILDSDRARRRQALKKLSYMFPMRPFFKFIYMYIFKMGFLDGKEGFIYCRLQSMYEYLIVLKEQEIKMQRQGKKL